MIDTGSVTDWQLLGKKDILRFDAENPRPVTLLVNTTGAAAIYVRQLDAGEEEELFLVGFVTGLEKLKFEVPGPYEVIQVSADDVRVYVKTGDGDYLHRDNLDERTFTKMYVPRTIDPNVQRVLDAVRIQQMQFMADMKYSREQEWNDAKRDERAQDVVLSDEEQDTDGDAPADEARPLEPPVADNGGQ